MTKETMNAKWMDVRAAAEYLSVSRSTLYQYAAKEQVPVHKIPCSNALRFLASELDEWMLEDTVEG
jgi:excisionase family DNA binding protein